MNKENYIDKIELILNTSGKYITNKEKDMILDYVNYFKTKNNVIEDKNIELVIELKQLQQENKKLKDKYNQLLDDEELLQMKIDKAIEYIELEQYKGTLWSVNSTDNLLEILKGDK